MEALLDTEVLCERDALSFQPTLSWPTWTVCQRLDSSSVILSKSSIHKVFFFLIK